MQLKVGGSQAHSKSVALNHGELLTKLCTFQCSTTYHISYETTRINSYHGSDPIQFIWAKLHTIFLLGKVLEHITPNEMVWTMSHDAW